MVKMHDENFQDLKETVEYLTTEIHDKEKQTEMLLKAMFPRFCSYYLLNINLWMQQGRRLQ